MTAKAKSSEPMPLWAKLLLALGAMGTVCVVVLAALAVFLLRPSSPPETAPIVSNTGLVKIFPGTETDRLLWSGMLAQFGDAVERDGTDKIPTLIDRRGLKSRWQQVQRYRMNFRGEGELWAAEYRAFGEELNRRVDAVVNDGELDQSERAAVRNVLRDAAEELGGKAWEGVK